MIRRVIAAVVAVLLATAGFVLVVRYANNADERAIEGMETDDVLVAVDAIPQGTGAESLTDLVEIQEVPRRFQVNQPVTDLTELSEQVAVSDIAAGEQLQWSGFATPEQMRGMQEFELPEEAENLHKVTVPLSTARAVGGDIAPGDTVGVFISLDASFNGDLFVDENGNVQFDTDTADAPESGTEGEAPGDVSLSLTKLVLEKVLVTRVQGGFVPSSEPDDEEDGGDDESEGDGGPAEEILVTLALEGGQAEQLVYGMEFGTVWLSYEPDSAEEDADDTKVVQLPDTVGDVLE